MPRYDTTLKAILRRRGSRLITELTGFTIERWRNVELPDVRRLSVDMLGEAADGRLIHIELQSTNDPSMGLRMLD